MEPVEPTLTELGIDKHDSHRWQAVAAIPEERFERRARLRLEHASDLAGAGRNRQGFVNKG